MDFRIASRPFLGTISTTRSGRRISSPPAHPHDLGLEDKKMLLQKAYEAVRPGGAFVAIDAIIDDERREHTAGLLESLVMLVEFGDEGFDYTGEQFAEGAAEAGFDETEIRPLSDYRSMAIAYKS
ncbi:MAG: methyltransferase [Bradymonadaceae bacterium]